MTETWTSEFYIKYLFNIPITNLKIFANFAFAIVAPYSLLSFVSLKEIKAIIELKRPPLINCLIV